jgi:quinolinate synthase
MNRIDLLHLHGALEEEKVVNPMAVPEEIGRSVRLTLEQMITHA